MTLWDLTKYVYRVHYKKPAEIQCRGCNTSAYGHVWDCPMNRNQGHTG